MDTDNPAPCAGRVTSWRVCYYEPAQNDDDDGASYWATYAVYRKIRSILPGSASGLTDYFLRVSPVFEAVRTSDLSRTRSRPGVDIDVLVSDGQVGYSDDFECFTDTFDHSPVVVQAGDVVGACVFNPQDSRSFARHQLDVIGEAENNGESLMGMSTAGCSMYSLPSQVLSISLSRKRNRRLHIHANIRKNITR